jgi:hypothetical protein
MFERMFAWSAVGWTVVEIRSSDAEEEGEGVPKGDERARALNAVEI